MQNYIKDFFEDEKAIIHNLSSTVSLQEMKQSNIWY